MAQRDRAHGAAECRQEVHAYRLPSSLFTVFASPFASVWSRAKRRLRFGLFFSRRWLFIARRRSSFPVPVTLNRFLAPLCVFCFGIVSRHPRILRRPEQHHHVPPVEERRRLDLADLAVSDPAAFGVIAEQAKTALEQQTAA